MEPSWDDLQYFLAAIEHRNLTRAARALGVGQATMSRRVAALEAQVGHRLFDRSQDGLQPTVAAKLLVPYAESMASAVRQATTTLQGFEREPEGVVRLALGSGMAVDVLPPCLPEFRRLYPRLRLEVLADNQTRDIARHEADVAVRSVAPSSGALVVRKVTESRFGFFGSPAFVRSLPRGVRLSQLDYLGWAAELGDIPPARWLAENLSHAPVLTTNSFLALRSMAQQGLGAVLFPELQATLAGLVPVPVTAKGLPVIPKYLIVHQALRHVPRVAVVVDFLTRVLNPPSTGQRKQ